MKVDPDKDEITVDGTPIPRENAKVYLMLNKPQGYVTTLSDEKGRATAADLVKDCGTRVWPVGRLDMYSEGLLLFTNDGVFTQKLEHPSGDAEKEYLVRVDFCDAKAMRILQGPITLDGQRLAPAKVVLLRQDQDSALLSITIHEGKNRQIRRMCEQAGIRVLRLKRIREHDLALDDLKSGTWRYLTSDEVNRILAE